MIRIALVEDDASYVSELVKYLEQYEEEYKEKIQVTVFSDGEDIAVDYKPIFDIILMDVEMAFMDGILGKSIQKWSLFLLLICHNMRSKDIR